MSEPTQAATGPEAESGHLPASGVPGVMLWTPWYGAGALAAVETMRVALELNRSLNDIGKGVVRRAQDEAIAALLRSLTPDAAPRPPAEAGYADLARMGIEAVAQSMTSAMRAFHPGAPAAEASGTGAKPAHGRSRPTA